jgi:hypothetical protein
MRDRFTLIAFPCLIAAMLGGTLRRAPSGSAVTDPDPRADDDPPLTAAFSFELRLADGGVRHLVLRDEGDWVLPLGEVQPFWACDTDVDYDSKGRYGMRVECGGDRFGATAYYSGYLGPERAGVPKWEVEVRAHGERPVEYTVPLPPQTQVKFITDLSDPQTACDPSGPTDVDVSVGPVEVFRGARGEPWFDQVSFRSKAYSIETTVGGAPGHGCESDYEWFDPPSVRFRCRCPQDFSNRMLEVIDRDGAFIWRDASTATCAGHHRIHGGWRLGCEATIHWPWEHIERFVGPLDESTLSIAKNI